LARDRRRGQRPVVSRPAVFLDRDGTLIRDVRYLGKPDQVELIPGAAAAVKRLNEAAWPVVIVTNQSGIARGYFTTNDYERVRRRTEELLLAAGARIDGTFMCPHHPDVTGPCECRKPGTLLFVQAAQQLDLDVRRSWYVGDKLRDVLPARSLGGQGILVPSDATPDDDDARAREEFFVAPSLDEAVNRIIESSR
jgi:D-glycero-D-manno-heptose 1,7-bisphosphate phosphatase